MTFEENQKQIQDNIKKAQQDREKSSRSAKAGGISHDATNFAIAYLQNQDKKTAGMATKEDYIEAYKYFFGEISNFLEEKEKYQSIPIVEETIEPIKEPWITKAEEKTNYRVNSQQDLADEL